MIIIISKRDKEVICIYRIKKLRERSGMTQLELAKRMGVEQNTISQWENGTRFPRADKLPQLARLLGCTIDELFEKEE